MRGKTGCAGHIVHRSIIVQRGEIQNRLGQVGADVHVVKRADHLWNVETGSIKAKTEGAKILRLYVFKRGAIQIGQEITAHRVGLALGLSDGLSGVGLAEVISQGAEERVAKAEFSGERHFRSARSASCVGP